MMMICYICSIVIRCVHDDDVSKWLLQCHAAAAQCVDYVAMICAVTVTQLLRRVCMMFYVLLQSHNCCAVCAW